MKINPVTNYIKWAVNRLQEFQKITQQHYIYKIISKEQCKKTGEEKFIIQVAGKNVFLQLSPKELVRDEAMLRGFSPLDVRTITFLACQAEKSSKEKKSLYRIIAQFFSRTKNEEMFTIQAEGNTAQITQSAQEISSNAELVSNFSSQDAHRIGYITGAEQVAQERNIFHSLNSNNSQEIT